MSRLLEAEVEWAAYRPGFELEPCDPEGDIEAPALERETTAPGAALAFAVALAALALAALAVTLTLAGGRPGFRVGVVAPSSASSASSAPSVSAHPGAGASTNPSAAAWADQPTTAFYEPRYGAETRAGAGIEGVDAWVSRQGPGVYTVMFPGVSATTGIATADAYSSAATCRARGWDAVGADERVDVLCTVGSTPADSRFDVSFTGNDS